jgi:hypothetical protein
MKYVISTVILAMIFFSCLRGYYTINASKHPVFVLQTTNYGLNDIVESDLERMKNNGNVLKFNRRDSQNVTYFKIEFPSKDSIKLKTLLMYAEPSTDSQFIYMKAYIKTKPEFLLFSEINENKDTVYYKKGRHVYVNKFRYRAKKVLGYKFYPY